MRDGILTRVTELYFVFLSKDFTLTQPLQSLVNGTGRLLEWPHRMLGGEWGGGGGRLTCKLVNNRSQRVATLADTLCNN